ncbi:MAG: serine/threonine-protein phosphatase [Rhodocyclales bacterium]|nr:serine/threonine-protein phosphatase [Rhodocyclales bacterium]
MPLTIDACVAQHIGDRKEQQDRAGIFPHPKKRGVVLAVVADGMGGHAGGAVAAEQVLYTAKSNLEHYAVGDETPRSLLEASVNEAHTMIKAMRMVNEKDPHSTTVMLLLQPGKVSWAHCGDSRLYRFRGDSTLFHTTDHSYVEHLVAQGKITPEQALVHPNRNILLTSMGGGEPPKVDFGEAADLQAGDCFLLCSDGLWGYFSDAELAGVVAAFSAREAAGLLVERARERASGEGDNISLAILKLIEVPAKAS